MAELPRSNRPAPRTAAAMEAELRRRIRSELAQAREESEGELDDASLADIIARAVAAGLGWHLEAPEHTRNATLSSRSWRPASGPRGGGPPAYERGPREGERGQRDFERGPREFDRAPREFDRAPREFERGPRDFDRRPRERDFDQRDDRPFQPRGGGFKPRGGGGFKPRGGGGGFKPRRPR